MLVYFPNVCVLVDYKVEKKFLKLMYQSLLVEEITYWVPFESKLFENENQLLVISVVVTDNCVLYAVKDSFLKEYEAEWRMVIE